MKSQKRPKRTPKASFCAFKAVNAYMQDVGETFLECHKSFIIGLIRARDYGRLSNVSEELGFAYLNPFPNQVLSQIAAIFKKNSSYANDALCTLAAKDSFIKAETICEATNHRLADFYCQEHLMLPGSVEFDRLKQVQKMRYYLGKLLGSRDSLMSSFAARCKISSGSTSTRTRANSQPYRKIGRKATVTPRALPYLLAYVKYTGFNPDTWLPRIVNCNKIAVVPKTWKTHRTIAAEPEANCFFQLGVDSYIKDRLLKVGIDLSDQSRNQSLALTGSLNNQLATIDLSMASDTMAYELVPFLFDDSWTNLFTDLRTPYYKGIFGSGKYAKFSSMGNGLTFPLETSIFWAACKAVQSDVISVYGDDIIVDSDKVNELVDLLSFLGFTVNPDKSFSSGPFRESCGADYWRGVNIRPFFCRKSDNLEKSMLCHNINGFVSMAGASDNVFNFAAKLQRRYRLPLVPYNDNTTSGVMLHPHHAYSNGLILNKNSILSFKGYRTVTRTRRVSSLTSMFYWFIEKERAPESIIESSVVISVFRRKVGIPPFARPVKVGSKELYGVVEWRVPIQRASDQMFIWSEWLAA